MNRILELVAAGAYSLGSPIGIASVAGIGLLLWHMGAF